MDEKRGAHAQAAAHAICSRLENPQWVFYVEQAECARHLPAWLALAGTVSSWLALASALAR